MPDEIRKPERIAFSGCQALLREPIGSSFADSREVSLIASKMCRHRIHTGRANVLAGLEGNALFQEETERVAQHWLMQEPSAALQWLAETDSDDSTRMRLLSAPGLAIPSPF